MTQNIGAVHGQTVALRQAGSLQEQLQYAKALASADLLPKAYRDKPANLLLALAYGDGLGLSISQVLNGINVIEGKPSMGSELMAALTRNAGHRVRISGDDKSATCSIWRADDPEFEYRAVWTVGRAVQAGLCTVKDGQPWARSQYGKPLPWETYTAAMLRARAVSECARMAVPDVLAGVSYTAEELETPQWVDADPPSPPPAVTAAPAAPPSRQRKPRKADRPPPESGVVEADTEPSMSADAEQPPAQTGEPDVSAALAAAVDADWRADWLGQLDEAIENDNLEAIQALGTKATQAGAEDLVEDARNAWSIVAGR